MSACTITAALLALAHLACGCGGTHATAPDSSAARSDAASSGDAPEDDGGGPVGLSTWPAEDTVVIACDKNAFGTNLSGLVYEAASATADAVLWAVQNDPSKLYRLTWNGSAFVPVTSDGWVTGRLLRYPTGTGSPDSEGLTRTEWTSSEIYVVAERDNDAPELPRQSILRYELGGGKGIVDATQEWLLTDDMPAANANQGLEGIAWIPDAHLVDRGFFDESRQAIYDPALYPDHGAGIFLVGRDDTGMIYGYVLDHQASTYTRVASFPSGQARSVDLTFDRDLGTLWSLCDGDCGGRMTLLDIDADPASATAGRFVLRATVSPPKALSGMNNEGIALAPVSECSNERRSFFWADDQESGGYAIRRGVMTCGRLY